MSRRGSSPTFSMLLQRFFTEHLQHHKAVSARTISAYRDTFRLLLAFAERTFRIKPQHFALNDLNAKLILAFLEHLEVDRRNYVRSRNAHLAALRSFLNYAAHHDIAVLQVVQQALAVRMKRFDRPLPSFLSHKELQAILDAPEANAWVGQRDRALFTLLYDTGARISEALHLQIGDLVLDNSPAIHILGKGRKERTAPLWRSTRYSFGLGNAS